MPDDKRASNHENINKNYNKNGRKFLLLRGCYPLSLNLLEIGESQTFAKLGVKRAGPLRFSPGMDVVFLLLLALAVDAGWVTSRNCKTVGFVFPQNHFINKAGAGKCEGRKKFSRARAASGEAAIREKPRHARGHLRVSRALLD